MTHFPLPLKDAAFLAQQNAMTRSLSGCRYLAVSEAARCGLRNRKGEMS
jgi:hypothetical protein